MKISEIDVDFISQYLNIELGEEDIALKTELESYINAAKSYAINYSQLPFEQLDELEYMVVPVLLLISEIYENKSLEGYKKSNPVFDSFMSLSKVMVL